MDLERLDFAAVAAHCSDDCVYEDRGLPALQAWFGEVLANPAEFVTRLIPDEQALAMASSHPAAYLGVKPAGQLELVRSSL